MTTRPHVRRAAGLVVGFVMTMAGPVAACDDLIGRLVTRGAEPGLQKIDCGLLKKVGVDRIESKITRVCYTSTGPTSRIDADLSITCKTSDAATLKSSIQGKATLTAEVRGADCRITFVDFKPSGDLAQAIAGILDVKGRIADALRKALAGAC